VTQLLIIAIYLALLLGLGVFASRLFRGTSMDYMLASHSIGPVLLLMSLFGTTMTAFALVGSTGEAFKQGVGVYGMLASSSGIIHSLCFFVLGVRLWSLGHKYGYTTQIQYFRDRLQSDRIGILLFPILVGLVIPYLLIGVMASGTVINSITSGAFTSLFAEHDYGVPPWLGSLVICVVVLIYVFFGGMRGTAWANTFQTLVFMVLGIVTFFVISDKLGGLEAASTRVLQQNPSRLKRSVDDADQKKYESTYARWETIAQFNFAARHKGLELTPEQAQAAYDHFKPRMPNWQTVAKAVYSAKIGLIDLTTAERNDARMLQDDRVLPEPRPDSWDAAILTHEQFAHYPRVADADDIKSLKIFAEKIGHPSELLDPNDPQQGKKWTRRKAGGVYRATSWAPDVPRGTTFGEFLTYMFVPLSVGMFPHLFQHWLTAKSAGTFKLAVVCHPVFIMIVWVPCVLVGVWATSAVNPATEGPLFAPHFPANAVLPAMVNALTTPVLAGLLTAGILAAIMSSLDSQFLCLGTMFTTDIVTHYAGKDRFNDRQIVMIARIFIVGIVAVTYGFSLFEPRRVFTLGVWCFSGFSSLFPLVFASLYWKRLTRLGAFASVIGAISTWLYMFSQSNFGADSQYRFLGLMPVATMIAVATGSIVVVSLITRPPEDAHLRRFFSDA